MLPPVVTGGSVSPAHQVDVAVAVSPKRLSSLRMANFLWLDKTQLPVSRIARNHPAFLVLEHFFVTVSKHLCEHHLYTLGLGPGSKQLLLV